MTESSTANFSRPAGVLLCLLLALRIAAALLITPTVVADSLGYVESARRIIETHTFAYPLYAEEFWARNDSGDLVFRPESRTAFQATPPNAYVMPGYPAFIALVGWLTGSATDPAVAVRLAQALLSVVTAALIYLIGRRIDERTGLVALAIAAVYPPFTLANSYLHTEVLYAFWLTTAVWLLLRWLDTPTLARAAWVGLACGAGALVRPTALPWFLLAYAAILLVKRTDLRRRITHTLAILAVTAVVLAPWVARNLNLYDTLIPFGTSAPVNIVQGLWQDASEPFPPAWAHNTQRASPESEWTRATLAVFAEAPRTTYDDLAIFNYYEAASRDLVRVALTERAFEVVSARARSIAVSLTWPHAVSPSALGGIPFTVSWIAHLALLAMGCVGIARLGRRSDMWLVASLPFCLIAATAVIFPLWRHYFPALGLIAVIAAIGLIFCYDFLRTPTRSR